MFMQAADADEIVREGPGDTPCPNKGPSALPLFSFENGDLELDDAS